MPNKIYVYIYIYICIYIYMYIYIYVYIVVIMQLYMWVWAPLSEGHSLKGCHGLFLMACRIPKKVQPLRFEDDIILAVTRGVENLPLFFHVWLRISKITRKGPWPKSYGQFERPSGCNPAFQAAKRQLQHLRSRQHQMRGETQRLSQVPKHFAIQPDPPCVFLAGVVDRNLRLCLKI